MSRDEFDNIYKALDYSFNAQVGKDGIEKAFEKETSRDGRQPDDHDGHRRYRHGHRDDEAANPRK